MSKVDQATLKMLSDMVATMAQMVEAMAVNQEDSKTESPLLTKKELAAYIKKSESWINTHRAELPQAVSDRPVTWLRADIDEWLERQKRPIKATIIAPEFGRVNVRRAAE